MSDKEELANQKKKETTGKRKPKSKRLPLIITIVLAAILVALLGYFGARYLKMKRAADAYKDLQKKATVTTDKDKDKDEGKTKHSKDFAALQAENSDIYAWINVPGTSVDYPVLMSPDDQPTDYYLMHNLDHSSGYPGCIFVDKGQAKDFTDFNTVVYGHNMNNGSMFASLHKFDDETFFKEHRTFTIETADKLLTYTIFCTSKFDDRYINHAYDFSTVDARTAYINDLEAVRDMTSHVDSSVPVSTSDHLVTLSTCVKGAPDSRYLVVGVLTKEEDLAD